MSADLKGTSSVPREIQPTVQWLAGLAQVQSLSAPKYVPGKRGARSVGDLTVSDAVGNDPAHIKVRLCTSNGSIRYTIMLSAPEQRESFIKAVRERFLESGSELMPPPAQVVKHDNAHLELARLNRERDYLEAVEWLCKQPEVTTLVIGELQSELVSRVIPTLVLAKAKKNEKGTEAFVRGYSSQGWRELQINLQDGDAKSALIKKIERRFPEPRALKRADVLQLAGPSEDIESFTTLMNDRIGLLVDTVKRWWDGEYGTQPDEDASLQDQMQKLTAVALEYFPAKSLVRVFQHLEVGGDNYWQSATGLASSAARVNAPRAGRERKPGPLEQARARGDTQEVERITTYQHMVDRVKDERAFRPLALLTQWREELGDDWVNAIIDDAAQYLRHHVKAIQRVAKDEKERLEALKKFTESKRGKAYLAIRGKLFKDGLPENQVKRRAILEQDEVVDWEHRKKKVPLIATESYGDLLERNTTLKNLVSQEIEYKRLTKPNTPPKWTPVSGENLRWPFISANLCASTMQWIGDRFQVRAILPRYGENKRVVRTQTAVEFHPGTRFHAGMNITGEWGVELRDETTLNVFKAQVKGFRLSRNNGWWEGKVTYEKFSEAVAGRAQDLKLAYIDRTKPPLQAGDMVCVFVLDPETKRTKRGAQSNGRGSFPRAGWWRVFGITERGARELENRRVYAYDVDRIKERALRTGSAPWWEGRSKIRPLSLPTAQPPSARGATRGISLPQMLNKDRALKREVKLLRVLQDPDNRPRAIAWCEKRLAHIEQNSTHNPRRAEQTGPRLRALLDTLRAELPPTHTQLEPFKTRIKALRKSLDGMKDAYRNSVAKEVVRLYHGTRDARTSDAVHYFRERYPEGAQILVTEYSRGKGSGKYKRRFVNRELAVLGPSKLYGLLYQKCEFSSPQIPVVTITTRHLPEDRPQTKSMRLAHTFFNPPPKPEKQDSSEEADTA